MRPHVFLTRKIPAAGMEMLVGTTHMRVFAEDRLPTREEIISGLDGCQGLLSLLTDAIDAEVMEAADLRVISNYAMGVDNIDLAAATRRGILVTNTPVDGLRESPADHTFALLLAAGRRIPEGDRWVRAGAFTGWGPLVLLGTDVYGKTLGIVGGGRIGSAVARRAQGFGMRLLYHSRSRNPEMERGGAWFVPLEQLLAEADFVTLHVPLDHRTLHLIGAAELRAMKPEAFLVNTSRGPVVDEEALVAALEGGELAGAALDVYEHEPKIHPALLGMANVVLAPHTASATLETRSEMAAVAARNLLDGLEGRRPRFLVNPEVLSQKGE